MATGRKRSRVWYAVWILLVVALGLASRRWSAWVPDWLGKYPGDTLWALMVYLGFAWIGKSVSPLRIGLAALAFSWGIEFSQLYQASWINTVRSYPIGHLVLGSHFHAPDLIAYAVGVATGVGVEIAWCRKKWIRS